MKFYQGLLPRIIWDPSNNKILIEFDRNGEFETEDENLIKLLRGKGYPIERDLIELERTGRLPHGGFEKVIGDHDLPSGRLAIEDSDSVHGTIPQVRPREMPKTEAEDVGLRKVEPKMNIPASSKSKAKTKKKRVITRRSGSKKK